MAKMIPPRRASANPGHVHEIPRPIIAAQASVPMVAVHMFRHRVLATSHPSTRPARCTGSTRSEFLSQPKREFGVFRGGDDGVVGWCQSKAPPLVNLGPRHRHLNTYSKEDERNNTFQIVGRIYILDLLDVAAAFGIVKTLSL